MKLSEPKTVRSFYLNDAVFRDFCHLCVDLGMTYNDAMKELITAYRNTGNPYDTISLGYDRERKMNR